MRDEQLFWTEGGRREEVERQMRALQERICAGVGQAMQEDVWDRSSKGAAGAGGGGRTRVLQDGEVFEKAGVNLSVIWGELPERAVQQMRADHAQIDAVLKKYASAVENGPARGVPFFATGVSVVIHAHNPHVPTVHCNFRYFELGESRGDEEPDVWWIGGGADLTPSYLYEEDAIHFHEQLKQVCDEYDDSFYSRFKQWCDEYFYLKHREEARGIGGIFFDDIGSETMSLDRALQFLRDCGNAFNPAFFPIVEKRKEQSFTVEEKHWQQIRRGRYVEFNLIWDRGTKFGLNTPGSRIESILMSLPLTSRWEYQHEPAEDSREAALLKVLKHPKEWVSCSK